MAGPSADGRLNLDVVAAELLAARSRLPEPASDVGVDAPPDELLRQAEQERSRRRGRRNLITLLVGAAILIGIALIVGSPRPRRRQPGP